MARQTWSASGREIWRPDDITIGTYKLDPNKSPMQNLWDLIYAQTSIWLNKYHVWSYDKSDIEALEQDLRMAIFIKFRQKVWDGEYDRRYSLYLQVRSVAWSVCSHCIKSFLKDIEQRNNNISADLFVQSGDEEDIRIVDTLTENDIGKYYSEYERRREADSRRKRARREAAAREVDPLKRRMRESLFRRFGELNNPQIRRNAYDDYLGECAIYGIEPITFDEFLRRNDLLDDPSPTGCSDQSPTCSQCGSSGKATEGKPQSAHNANGHRS